LHPHLFCQQHGEDRGSDEENQCCAGESQVRQQAAGGRREIVQNFKKVVEKQPFSFINQLCFVHRSFSVGGLTAYCSLLTVSTLPLPYPSFLALPTYCINIPSEVCFSPCRRNMALRCNPVHPWPGQVPF